MLKKEIRPNVTMAYRDDYFGEPWIKPEPVVMFHGVAEGSIAWTCWVPHFSRKYRVIRPDMLGYGESTEPDSYSWTTKELAADYGRFLDVMNIESCHLIGAKYGGATAMTFAYEQPHRVRTLCLFGSPVRGGGRAIPDRMKRDGVYKWAKDTQRSRLGSAASNEQVEWWTDELMGKANLRPVVACGESRVDMDLEEQLRRITAPTLIVTTQESDLQSVAAVERYQSKIKNSKLIVMPGDGYHIAALEPDKCAKLAFDFIESAHR